MSSVDERIVEMRFDNQQFESGVQKSLKTLDQLKSGLNLENSARSLENLQASANSLDLSGIASGVDAVSNRVSALGIVGDQVIRYLTNEFIQLGQAAAGVVKSLTTDQIGSGFSKYEQKIQSVQTIMNATGMSVDDVNSRIDKLNWFTDETSYSLTDMVSNIGKFTSSGVDLDTAVTAMIGIADAAGLAGVSVSGASHAMEGFSKAIARGAMDSRSWDWIRTANMDTQQFKQSMIDAAVRAGTLTKSVDADGMISYATATGKAAVSITDFQNSLHEGWLTKGVMTDALRDFGGATEDIYAEYLRTGELTSEIIERMDGQLDELGLKSFRASQEAKTFSDAINSVKDAVSTGWMKSFEYIFGNKEEATRLWTDVANELWEVFASSGERRNEILEAWHNAGGYQDLVDGISDAWASIKSISTSIKEAFSDLFPGSDEAASKLISITGKIKNFGAKFKEAFYVSDKYREAFEKYMPLYEQLKKEGRTTPGADKQYEAYMRLQKIKEAFTGLKSIVDLVKFSFKSLGTIFSPLLKLFKIDSGEGFLDFAANIGNFITNTVEAIKESELLQSVIEGLTSLVDGAVDIFKSFGVAIKTVFTKIAESEAFKNITSKVKSLASSFKEAFGPTVSNWVSKLTTFFSEFAENFDADAIYERILKVYNILKTFWGILGDVWQRVVDWFSPAFESLKNIFSDLGIEIDPVLDGITEFLEKLKESDNPIELIISKLQEFKDYLSGLWDQIKEAFGKLDFSTIWDTIVGWFNQLKERIKGVLDSIGEVLANLDWGKILAVALGIGFAFTLIKIAKAIFEVGKILRAVRWVGESISGWFDMAALKKVSKAALLFASAIGIVAASLFLLSKADPDGLKQAGIAIGGIAVVLAGFVIGLSVLNKKELLGDSKNAARSMLAIAAAIGIIAMSLKTLSKVDDLSSPGWWIVGLMTALAAIVGILGFLNKRELIGDSKGAAKMMIGMAIAVSIIVYSLKTLTKLVGHENYSKAFWELFGIMSGLALVTSAFGWITNELKWNSKAGVQTMLGLVISISLIINSIKSLTKLVGNENYAAAFWSLIGLLTVVTLFSDFLLSASKKAGKSKRAVITMLGMAASILIIVHSLKSLTRLVGHENYNKAYWELFGLMSIVMLMATLFGKLTHKASWDAKSGAITMLGMASSILIIVQALKTLTKLVVDPNIGNSILALTLIMTALTAFTYAFAKYVPKSDIKAGPILAMALAVGILVAALSYLTLFKFGDLMKSVVALGLVLAAFGTAIRLASVGGEVKFPTILQYVAGVALILAAGYEIQKLAAIPWQNLASAVGAISGVLLAVGLSMRALTKTNALDTKGDYGGLFAGLAVIFVIGSILGYMMKQDFSWKSMASAGGSISAVLLSLAGAIRITQGVPLGGSLGALGDILLWIIGLSLVLSLLSLIPIEDANVERVERLGSMIGGFVGGIVGGLVGGFGLGMSMALPAIGTYLSQFMTNLEPFINGISNLPDGFESKIDALGTGILNLANAEVKQAWSDILELFSGKDTAESLVESLEIIAEGMASIGETIGNDQVALAINNIKEMTSALATYVNDPLLNTYTASNFGLVLNTFAEDVSTAASKLNEIDEVNGNAIDTIIQNIKDLQEYVNPENADLNIGKILGENIVSDFITAMTSLDATDSETMGQGFLDRIRSAFSMLSVAGEDEVSKMSEFGQFISNSICGSIITAFSDESMAETFSSIGQQLIDNINNSDSLSTDNVLSIGENIVDNIVSGFSTLASGDKIIDAGTKLGQGLKDNTESGLSGMESIGSFAAQGLINGVLGKVGMAFAVGKTLGAAVVLGAAAGAVVASPSKATYKIGEYVGEGLGLGMLSMASYVEDSAERMAGNSILSVASVFDNIDAALAGEVNWNPVITPVLDLSEVSYGASQINGILNSSASMQLAGQLYATQAQQDLSDLLVVGRAILKEIQNGRDVYLDDGVLAGRINRRLGSI